MRLDLRIKILLSKFSDNWLAKLKLAGVFVAETIA